MRDLRITFSQLWRKQSITRKFDISMGIMHALFVLITVASSFAVSIIRRETGTALEISTEIQRLVLEIDGGLEKARRMERDFFIKYPIDGYQQAYQESILPSNEQIDQIIQLSVDLQKILESSDVSEEWQNGGVNINLILSAAQRHADTVAEATDLVSILTVEESKLIDNLFQIEKLIRPTENPNLLALFHEMLSHHRAYLFERKRPLMQSAFNLGISLRGAIRETSSLTEDEKSQIHDLMGDIQFTANQILDLDVAIQSKYNEFDLQIEAIDPITDELVLLTNQEIDAAQERIKFVSYMVIIIVVLVSLIGLLGVARITLIMNRSITKNILRLSQSAAELQRGNLAARVEIDSPDELGQLAEMINKMAVRLGNLIGGLERTVAERTSALKYERDRIQNYLDLVGVIILAIDEKGAIQLINKSGLEILGYEEPELLGKNWFDTCLPKRFRDQQDGNYRQLIEGEIGITEYFENRVVTKTGEERIIAWHSSELHNEAGELVGTLSSGEDITESIDTEEEIQRRNLELAVLVDISHHLLGYREQKELLSFIVEAIVKALPGADAASLWEYDEVKNKMIPQVWHGHVDDEIMGLELDPNSSLIGLVYRTHQSHLIGDTNQEGAFGATGLNLLDTIQSVIGVPLMVQDQFVGGLFAGCYSQTDAFTEDDLRLVESIAFQTSLALDNARLFRQISGHADSLEKSIAEHTDELHLRVVEGEQLNSGMINLMEDIQRANQQVSSAANRLTIANEELEAFAYSVSHDLSAPLRGIRGFASILAERHRNDLNQEGQEYIDHVVKASNYMAELIDDLLEYSRLGQRASQAIPLDLGMIIEEVLANLSDAIRQSDAQIILPESYPFVFGDRTPLHQVFLNLFDNAIKYQHPGRPPKIELCWREDSEYAMIEVRDNGIGIPEENREQVFIMFQRLHSEDVVPGTGIGLALVRKAVLLMDGEISVDSAKGGGTIFEVKLPLKNTSDD